MPIKPTIMLGGFGSLNHMIITLRNNKNLLSKKRSYFKPSNYQTLKNEYYNTVGNAFNIQKATPEQLHSIRQKIIENRKKEWRKLILLFSVLLPLICFGLYALFANFSFGFPKNEMEVNNEIVEDKSAEKYLFYIEDGDRWVARKNYSNAIFQYQKALELHPNNFDATYRLALGYSYRCQYNFEDCDVGMRLISGLERQFPNNPEIQKVKAIFIHWGE